MKRIEAFPGDNLAELAGTLKSGGTIFLNPGTYGPELFDGLKGTPDAPITILGTQDAVFDGRKRYQDVRTELNIMAYGSEAVREAKGRDLMEQGALDAKIDYIPSLGTVGQRGFIRIRNCKHLRLMGFSMKGAWPTCVAINQSQFITLAGLEMQEGTFAIHVEGAKTTGITIHRCSWIQDITESLMWEKTDWKAIHGDDFHPGDERGLDGDFFRSHGIEGKVTVRYCTVRHAFNAVHMYHGGDGSDPTRNRDVRIHDNTFEYIRDNAIEAEHGAINWWVYRNDMRNVHKWLALEVNHSSHVYCFANTCWFDSVPSSKAVGSSAYLHSGGGFFKTRKKSKQITAHGPHYFFNNSAYIRTGYLKKGVLKNFSHFNNAIHCVEDPSRSGKEKQRPFFWQPGKPPKAWKGGVEPDMNPDDEDAGSHFTRLWGANKVNFTADVIKHPDIPERARKLGYPMEKTVAAEPGFRKPSEGDLKLRKGAAAAKTKADLQRISLQLIDTDKSYDVPTPKAAGAWQGKDRLRLGITVPGFQIDSVWQDEVKALNAILDSVSV